MSAWKIPDEIKGLTEHLITVKDSGEDNSFWKYFGIRLSAQSPPESGAEEQLRAIIEILERQSKEPRIVLTPDVMRRLADAACVRYAGSAAYRRYRLSRERGELTEPVPFEGMSGETTLSQQTDDEGNSVG